jgi:colicin import membrane protein
VTTDSLYAKPVLPRIVVRPALASLLLHGLVLAMLTVNWSGTSTKVVQFKPAPTVINARLVDASELKPRAAPPKAAPPKAAPPKAAPAKPKPKPNPKPNPKPQAKPTAAPPKATPKAKATPKPEPAAKPEPAKTASEPARISQQELAEIARADLARAMAEESVAHQAAATAGELSASYASLIQQTVINYWSRPPSARNGMEALLTIQLIPTGEVISVTVTRSSGSTAFDRSAVNAVEKAGSFPELRNLPPGEFEKTFRRFRLLFRPEDLRY